MKMHTFLLIDKLSLQLTTKPALEREVRDVLETEVLHQKIMKLHPACMWQEADICWRFVACWAKVNDN